MHLIHANGYQHSVQHRGIGSRHIQSASMGRYQRRQAFRIDCRSSDSGGEPAQDTLRARGWRESHGARLGGATGIFTDSSVGDSCSSFLVGIRSWGPRRQNSTVAKMPRY
ncbi:hypothetical protein J3E68DRAFT_402907 [Trichoderma sp. SZMC 28012]